MDKKVYELIAEQFNQKIIERKTCPYTGEEFAVYEGDRELLDAITPLDKGGQGGFAKNNILPNPTISPDVRRLLRMMRRNERHLYRVHSKAENKKQLSMFAPDTVHDVTSLEYQLSDAFDPYSYGQDFDPTQSLSSQWQELRSRIPHIGVINIKNENGQYNNYTSDSKNIYLSFDVMFSENIAYGTNIKHVNNGYDLLNMQNSDQVYECTNGRQLTKCAYTTYCTNCYDCYFSFRCFNCTNCFFCSKLVNKENYIDNKPASKEEIQALKENMKSYTKYVEYIEIHNKLRHTEVEPNYYVLNCENCFGSSLYDSKNSFRCFDAKELENCRYCLTADTMKNCMDTTIFNPESENCYLTVCGGYRMKNSIATAVCRESDHTYYSYWNDACHNTFASINIFRGEHVILNKKYDPQTREKTVEQIIEKMKIDDERGEFFPPSGCPFPYNDSVAMDYHPVKTLVYPDGKQQIMNAKGAGTVYIHEPEQLISIAELDLGGTKKIPIKRRTREVEINIPDGVDVIDAIDLPDSIDDVDDSICKKIIRCVKTDRLFRITPQELQFYRHIGLPLPREHQDIRHQHRLDHRPPRTRSLRQSDKTGNMLVSVNGIEQPNPVREMDLVYKEMFG